MSDSSLSELAELYATIEYLRRKNFTIDAKLEQEVSEAEESIIKREILPVLTKTIETALQQVKRKLVLVVDHVPGQPLDVRLSRKTNIAALLADAKKLELDPEVPHKQHSMRGDITRGPKTGLIVTFPDGSTIAERFAADTLEQVVRKIGVTRVRQAVEEHKLRFNKVPVISNRRDEKYGNSQRDLGEGWLLITHTSNKQKKKFLDQLSAALDLRLKVDLIP